MTSSGHEELHNALVNLALAFYVGELCRVCRKPITRQDLDDGAVYAGYSDDSRSAHKECWEQWTALR